MTVSTVNLAELKQILLGYIRAKGDANLPRRTRKYLPVPYIWGPPGVGKSNVVEQIGAELGIPVEDKRLSQLDPTDLRGLPYIGNGKIGGNDAEKHVAWARPDIIPDRGPVILFLDELNIAELMTQKSAYQLILDGRIGPHALPEDCYVVAAGNRMQDRGATQKLPAPLANRFQHYEVVIDKDTWMRWALNNGIHPWVMAYHNFTEGTRLFVFDDQHCDKAYPTPRSWEYVSNSLSNPYYGDAEKERAVKACVGEGEAIEFLSYIKVKDSLPDTEKVLEGREKRVPGEKSAVSLLSSIMVARLAQAAALGDGTAEKLERAMGYIKGFPTEFQVTFVMDALKIDALAQQYFPKSKAYREWVQANKDVILNTSG